MMNPSELDGFLNRVLPAMVGTVATRGADDSPHVVPVWYRWDSRLVHVWSLEGRVWVQNARRDPRVAFSVQEMEPPFGAVVMHGRAEVTTGGGPEQQEEIRRITSRYLPEEEVHSYMAQWPHASTIVRIRPTTTRSWNRGY